jgi:hypothetical protein
VTSQLARLECGAGNTEDMRTHRRHVALVLLVVAVAAVVAFGTGLTLCIDWGGASAPPHQYGRPGALILSLMS